MHHSGLRGHPSELPAVYLAAVGQHAPRLPPSAEAFSVHFRGGSTAQATERLVVSKLSRDWLVYWTEDLKRMLVI